MRGGSFPAAIVSTIQTACFLNYHDHDNNTYTSPHHHHILHILYIVTCALLACWLLERERAARGWYILLMNSGHDCTADTHIHIYITYHGNVET
jgi:hypothetical protein